ncbi:MAG: imidazoleglycerol-phosphate dehydratase HisB [bacterium]|nr:imidazoleglycerol-phosphate dehydratase HisB [bacterium]
MSRKATCRRSTKETRVSVMLDLDGSGDTTVRTGIGFFDHLLTSLAHHALFDLAVTTEGDVEVDDHHTVEDTALCLGEALGAALGDRTGIHRFGDARVPMDEAIADATVDVGGRPYSVTDLELANPAIGNLTAQNIPHALEAFARSAGITMHVTATGRNDHHVAEAAFKALARALRAAVSPDPRRSGVPSTKGMPSPEAS